MPVVSRGRLLSDGEVAGWPGCWLGGWADAGGAELSEGLSELMAQPLVVLGQFPVAGECDHLNWPRLAWVSS
jgi:hypothetical protein